MQRRMFLAKIHRATVTHADLEYEGSVTIDADLLHAAGMLEHEEVHIWNVTRGTRLVTYTLAGPHGSGVICVNGAAAHHMSPGDIVILATFATMDDAEARAHVPTVVRVDRHNRLVELRREIPGPAMPERVVELN
ncbi:MAG: aspartate 1-decarboxylase [Alphaproteobacteria bacterium]|nr:aspartate 1-decarboxylase [Alphaproteobacteria bacterium]